MLYQADIKYGPYLPIGKDDKKQDYLSAIIEDSLQNALMGYEKPDYLIIQTENPINDTSEP